MLGGPDLAPQGWHLLRWGHVPDQGAGRYQWIMAAPCGWGCVWCATRRKASLCAGAPLRCILELCSLSTEQCIATGIARGPHSYLPIPLAYFIWDYIERGLRPYEAYGQTIPNWIPVFCPTALAEHNGLGRTRAAQLLLGVLADYEPTGAALPPVVRSRVVLDLGQASSTEPGHLPRHLQRTDTPSPGPRPRRSTSMQHTGV